MLKRFFRLIGTECVKIVDNFLSFFFGRERVKNHLVDVVIFILSIFLRIFDNFLIFTASQILNY